MNLRSLPLAMALLAASLPLPALVPGFPASLEVPPSRFHAAPPLPPEELVVVVNSASGVTRMTQEEVVAIFMGRQNRLPSGLLALPVEPVGDAVLRARFYGSLANVSLPQVRSYWARLFFSGQAQPPRQAQTPEEVIRVVLDNRGAIGFVPRRLVDARVQSVLVLRGSERP